MIVHPAVGMSLIDEPFCRMEEEIVAREPWVSRPDGGGHPEPRFSRGTRASCACA